jgi:anti-sigma factor RsiW
VSEHPWTDAWHALSPLRREALIASVVEGQRGEELASRLGRSIADAEALVASTVLAFRREVVLARGTGYDEECGALVLRLVDSGAERLERSERKALAAHADHCPDCAEAVGELLELDARLREGLLVLLGAPQPSLVPAARVEDEWAPAYAALTAERQVALLHGAVGAERPRDLAARLDLSEDDARSLASSSVVAFRQGVVRGLDLGADEACDVVGSHRSSDGALDPATRKALQAHASVCADCAPAVAQILALHATLRPRVAGIALGEDSAAWLARRPRRSWVPGVEQVEDPRRGRLAVAGAGMVAAAAALVVATSLLGSGDPADTVVAAPAAPAEIDEVTTTTDTELVAAQPVSRSPRPIRADRSLTSAVPITEAGTTAGGAPAGQGGTGGSTTPDPAPQPQPPVQPQPQPQPQPEPEPEPEPQPEPEPTPNPGVSVDTETGSVTVAVGPIVVSTPPILTAG